MRKKDRSIAPADASQLSAELQEAMRKNAEQLERLKKSGPVHLGNVFIDGETRSVYLSGRGNLAITDTVGVLSIDEVLALAGALLTAMYGGQAVSGRVT